MVSSTLEKYCRLQACDFKIAPRSLRSRRSTEPSLPLYAEHFGFGAVMSASMALGELPIAGDIGLASMESKFVAEAQRVFEKLDKDKDDKLNRDELLLAFRHMGKNPTRAEFQKLASELAEANRNALENKLKGFVKKKGVHDETHDKFEIVDFLTLLHMDLKEGPNDERELLEAFATFDVEQNGHVTVDQLRQALTSMGSEPLSESEVNDIIEIADREKDGLVNYEELMKLILQPIFE
ncbi:hypothetical protein AB1Y20_005813 [Prymnesium parvum]|uniref:EF-hand domain-containing protein n=1 Tax=Prymnesium parvum TaxID=97485 RepID=A0AB34IZX6_PRYPA